MLTNEMVQNLIELVEFGDESFIEMVKQLDGKNIQEELLLAGLAEIKYVKPPDTRYLYKFLRVY